MIEPNREMDKRTYPNQGSSPFAIRCRVPPELVEEILVEALSQEIHETLTSLSSFDIHIEQVKRRCESWLLDSYSEQDVLRSATSRARRSTCFPNILELLRVSRQFRSIIQRHLTIICPVEFQDPESTLLPPQLAQKSSHKDLHPILKTLCGLRGVAETCFRISKVGMKQWNDIYGKLDGTIVSLWRGAVACRTPLARVYISLARLRLHLYYALTRSYYTEEGIPFPELEVLEDPPHPRRNASLARVWPISVSSIIK
jgi:hypothetical protein